jgi:heparin/heparan-sulfate lyase
MLVYDAAYRDTLPEEDRKYYSGSQVRLRETSILEKWNAGEYDIAKILGHAEGYREDGTSKFAYLSGETTKAYKPETVDFVKRSMLTVMTESKDIPMLFFVYDDVTSKNEKAIKKFLLHTINEPKIDGNTVTVTQEGGKLVLTSLLGADRIEGIGGKGKGFWAGEDGTNGYNIADQVEDGWEDSLWGRVEINATGRATDKMLNVIYVTDKGQKKDAPEIDYIKNDSVEGSTFGDIAAVFMTSRERVDSAVSFDVDGKGDMKYYVSGVAAGKWSVSVDGKSCGTATATEEGGLLVFTAPAGEVTLTPAK